MNIKIGLACIIIKDNKILLGHRSANRTDTGGIHEPDTWTLPGGKQEFDETIIDGIIREVKEETNLNILSYEYRGKLYFINGEYEEVIYLYTSSSYSGEIKECDEGTLQYFPKNEIFNLPMWEGDKIFLKYLLTNTPYFELKLIYKGSTLLSAERIK